MFEEFLKTLASVLDFSQLKPDENGACQIIIKDGNIPILFEWDDELVPRTVLASSLLAAFPLEYRADIYQMCLIANSTQEEILSTKPDEDLVYLHRRFHPEIQKDSLETSIQSFVASSKRAKSLIENLLKNPPQVTQRPGAGIQIFPYRA